MVPVMCCHGVCQRCQLLLKLVHLGHKGLSTVVVGVVKQVSHVQKKPESRIKAKKCKS